MEILDVERARIEALQVSSFATHTELFQACQEDNLCNCLIICTPNFNHVAVVKDALRMTKCHILVEKPLCTTVKDCRDVEQWLEEDKRRGNERVFWVGMEYRFIPPIEKLILAGDSGKLGSLKMLSIREHRFPFLAKVGHWNRLNALSGGTLVEKCCHFFDLMRRILRSDPVKVIASGGQNVCYKQEQYKKVAGREDSYLDVVVDSSSEDDDDEKQEEEEEEEEEGSIITRSDILDNAFVIVEFGNGSRAMLDLCMFAETSFNQDEIALVGDKGKAECFGVSHGTKEEDKARVNFRVGQRPDGQWDWQSETRPPSNKDLPRIEEQHVGVGDPRLLEAGAHEGGTYFELQHFLREIVHLNRDHGPATGTDSELVSARDGTWAVAMGVAAQTSIAEGGRPVLLSEVMTDVGHH